MSNDKVTIPYLFLEMTLLIFIYFGPEQALSEPLTPTALQNIKQSIIHCSFFFGEEPIVQNVIVELCHAQALLEHGTVYCYSFGRDKLGFVFKSGFKNFVFFSCSLINSSAFSICGSLFAA